MGQVTNSRRHELVGVLRGLPNGKLVETKGFSQGLDHEKYMSVLFDTKIAPCGGSPATADSFRVYEALEAGCIPVLDRYSAKRDTKNYWDKVLGKHPFYVVDNWNEFQGVYNKIMMDYPNEKVKVRTWWNKYKKDFVKNFKLDLSKLCRI
jgi:hypothetical protein